MRLQIISHLVLTTSPPRGAQNALRRRPRRRGATLVEFAAVAPVFFVFLFVMFEFGRLMMVEQVLTNAAREGARRGILEQTTVAEVEQTVQEYLAKKTISGATVNVAPDQLDQVGFGSPVTVTVSVPYGAVSWLPAPRWLDEADLLVQSVMRAERPE
jgi:Flp pilus assembly protein TadG